jgi:nitroreductase
MTTASYDARTLTPENVDKALRDAAARATLAPSIHNTQPWRFVVSSDRLDLYADRSRSVPAVDPSGRQLSLSCGAALFGTRVALAAAGLDVVTSLAQRPSDPDLLASITVVGRVVAGDNVAQRLDSAADLRHSNRRRFEPIEIPVAALELVTRAAAVEGASLRAIHKLSDRVSTAVLTQRAESVQSANPAYLAELQAWTTADPQRRDGIATSAVPHGTEAAHDDIPIRRYDATGELPAETRSRLDEAMLALCTPGDSPRDWLIGGQALARVLLELSSAGLQSTILSQVTEVPNVREILRHELRLPGHVQLLLQVDVAEPTSATPRRYIDVISSSA